MPSFEIPDISIITKLPELFTSSTQSCRKGWFSQPSRDMYVPSKRGNAASGKGAQKGGQQLSQNSLSRRASTHIQSLQRQVMGYRQQLSGFKPAPDTPLWTVQKNVASAYQGVKNQFYAIPGYWERAISPVKSWWQGMRLQEKPLPTIPKPEIHEVPTPTVFNPQSARSGFSQINEKTLPLRIEKKSASDFKIERKTAPSLSPKEKGPSLEDMTASIDDYLGELPAPKIPEKTTGWNGKRKPVKESTDSVTPDPLKAASGNVKSEADNDPLFDFLMRDLQTPVESNPHLADPAAYESRTLIDDLLADLRTGKYSPRASREATRQSRSSQSSLNTNPSDSTIVKPDTPTDAV